MNRFLTRTLVGAALLWGSGAAADNHQHVLHDGQFWDVMVSFYTDGIASCDLAGRDNRETALVISREMGSNSYTIVFVIPDANMGPGRATSWTATLDLDMMGRAGTTNWSLNDSSFEIRTGTRARYTIVTLSVADYEMRPFLFDLARFDRVEIFAHDFRLVSILPLAGSRVAVNHLIDCLSNLGLRP